jgi:hypothetical protein
MQAVATAAMENRMVIALRWASLLTTAGPLGAAGAQVLELPNKLAFDGPLWLSAMLAVFFRFNAPVNGAFAGWAAETLPVDWPGCRRQWELGHAIACVLAPTAFCTLLRAAFVEASARRGAIERPAASFDPV